MRFERQRPRRPTRRRPRGGQPPGQSPRADEAPRPEAARPLRAWNQEFELVVNFEINQPERAGRGYRRPYVAVWVEDKDGFPVRNLSLWVSMGGAGPFQWLPDLKRWYKADQAGSRSTRRTCSSRSPARPGRPANTRSIWDGKDDHGKPLPAGEYTVYIDAAREHGTYQSIRKEVTLADKPFTEELKGNVEIKSASIEYRRKLRRRRHAEEVTRGEFVDHSGAGWPSASPSSCAGCISTCRCSAWRPSSSSA